jgi:hypothetical protein
VWHEGLIYKMTKLGIGGNMLRTIHSFLSERRITTRMSNQISSAIKVTDGLPQGAVLSPLLFLIYINDLPNVMPEGVECPIFADDCCVYTTSSDVRAIQGRLNAATEQFRVWTELWKLTLSPTKTQAILFTLTPRPPTITLRLAGNVLPIASTVTYLGITFDRQLTWKAHVDRMTTQARHRIVGLQRLSGHNFGPNRSTMRGVYIGFYPLSYGIWS